MQKKTYNYKGEITIGSTKKGFWEVGFYVLGALFRAIGFYKKKSALIFIE